MSLLLTPGTVILTPANTQGQAADETGLKTHSGRLAPTYGFSQPRQRRRVLPRAHERLQIRDEQRDLFKRRPFVFFEAEPAGSEAAVAVRLFSRDQGRELERLGNRHPADLSGGHLGEYEVASFQRPAEDGSRVALRGRRSSSRGRAAEASFRAVEAKLGSRRTHAPSS